MKSAGLQVLFLLASLSLFSQDNKIIKINALNQSAEVYKSEYMYPVFSSGKIIFTDAAIAEAKMNFNRLSNQMLFLTPAGDTLALAHPETVSKVLIDADTFCFFENVFIQQMTHNRDAPNLFVKQNLKYIGKEKKGAYGTYSTVSSSNSNSTFTNDDQITKNLSVDENAIYELRAEYYFSDSLNNFFPARKSNLYKMFPQQENRIKTYIKANKIDFDKKADLLQLVLYIQSLKQEVQVPAT